MQTDRTSSSSHTSTFQLANDPWRLQAKKRTLSAELSSTHTASSANKHMPPSFLEEWVPKDNESVAAKLKVNKEKEQLSTWKFWGGSRVKTTLVVSKCKDGKINSKRKFEKFGEFEYYGPFTLFDKLKEYHEGTFRFLESKHFNFSSAMRISGLLNDVDISESNYRLLQFNVITFFTELSDLYWNLIYWLSSKKRDYLFMLPYEIDLENQNDFEESWNGSDQDLTPRLNASWEGSPYLKKKGSIKQNHDFKDAIGNQDANLYFRYTSKSQIRIRF